MKEFKVGQEVLIDNGLVKYLSIVSRITPKGFIKVNGVLYNKNGYVRTQNVWDFRYITNDMNEINEFKESQFIKTIKDRVRIYELSYEQATKIGKIIGVCDKNIYHNEHEHDGEEE